MMKRRRTDAETVAASYGEFLVCSAQSFEDDQHVLFLQGEFSRYVVRTVREAIRELDLAYGARLVIDLSEVTFIDSAALELLVVEHRALAQRAGTLSVVCPDLNLRKTFVITMIDLELPVLTSLQDALY